MTTLAVGLSCMDTALEGKRHLEWSVTELQHKQQRSHTMQHSTGCTDGCDMVGMLTLTGAAPGF